MLPGRKLGSRTLRFGQKGTDVNRLHEFLRLQGYDLGEETTYGYLTKDAVTQWQRDHGLVPDGIAGQRFFALALKKDLPIRRRVHVVQSQETLEQIAQLYSVGVQAFSRHEQRSVYPGQRLVFFDREVWGMCSNMPKTGTPPHALTGLVYSGPPKPPGQWPCVIRPVSEETTDTAKIHRRLKTPRKRKATAKSFLESAAEGCGLYLPWKTVAPLDGARYVRLLRDLRRKLVPQAMLWVELGPGVPSWKVWGGVDYASVNELVDRVVLELPLPLEPGPLFQRGVLEDLVSTLLPCVHSWKILLKAPVYALEWEIGAEGASPIKLAYQAALSRAFRHGARLEKDENGGLYYRYQNRGRQFQIRLPHYSSMGEISAVANRHNLAGVILDELGMEDPRIWQALSSYFRTASLIISGE